jgi:hypothetical protein
MPHAMQVAPPQKEKNKKQGPLTRPLTTTHSQRAARTHVVLQAAESSAQNGRSVVPQTPGHQAVAPAGHIEGAAADDCVPIDD